MRRIKNTWIDNGGRRSIKEILKMELACVCSSQVNDLCSKPKKNVLFFFSFFCFPFVFFLFLKTLFYLLVIIGLFDTITSTSKSKDCPGRCVHVLAALLCEKVRRILIHKLVIQL